MIRTQVESSNNIYGVGLVWMVHYVQGSGLRVRLFCVAVGENNECIASVCK